MRGFRGGLLANLGLFSLSTVLSLALLEGTLRIVNPEGEVIGRMPPGIHTFRNHEFVQRMTVNRFGFRESGFSPTRGSHNVLLLGDSFLEGTGQADQEAPAWLLNRRFPHREVQFFNAGISGTDIADHQVTYRRVASALDEVFSSVVVVLFLGNDFLDYGRIGVVKARRESDRSRQVVDERRLVRILGAVVPRTLALARQVRSLLEGPPSGTPVAGSYGAHTHIDWFNANLDYFGRGPLTEGEIRSVEERFARVPTEIRDLMSRGLVNQWCYHPYLLEPLQDLIFNMDSELNERLFESTMGEIGGLIEAIEQPVSLVLIPDKLQVSEKERRRVREILGPGIQEDELENMLALNARMVEWLGGRFPDVRVKDLTPELMSRGAQAFYYTIDGHMRPSGSQLLADGILEVLEGVLQGSGTRSGGHPSA